MSEERWTGWKLILTWLGALIICWAILIKVVNFIRGLV